MNNPKQNKSMLRDKMIIVNVVNQYRCIILRIALVTKGTKLKVCWRGNTSVAGLQKRMKNKNRQKIHIRLDNV